MGNKSPKAVSIEEGTKVPRIVGLLGRARKRLDMKRETLRNRTTKKKQVCKSLGITESYLTQILAGNNPLTDKLRKGLSKELNVSDKALERIIEHRRNLLDELEETNRMIYWDC